MDTEKAFRDTVQNDNTPSMREIIGVLQLIDLHHLSREEKLAFFNLFKIMAVHYCGVTLMDL